MAKSTFLWQNPHFCGRVDFSRNIITKQAFLIGKILAKRKKKFNSKFRNEVILSVFNQQVKTHYDDSFPYSHCTNFFWGEY
jgi:hypothetical protein